MPLSVDTSARYAAIEAAGDEGAVRLDAEFGVCAGGVHDDRHLGRSLLMRGEALRKERRQIEGHPQAEIHSTRRILGFRVRIDTKD